MSPATLSVRNLLLMRLDDEGDYTAVILVGPPGTFGATNAKHFSKFSEAVDWLTRIGVKQPLTPDRTQVIDIELSDEQLRAAGLLP